jgi:hypothetical protein
MPINKRIAEIIIPTAMGKKIAAEAKNSLHSTLG